MRQALLNLLLRRLVKPVWRGSPTIETLRRISALIDRRLAGAGAREPAQVEHLSGELDALWLGPRDRAPAGAILYLHGGAFCVHLPALYRGFCADLSRRCGVPVLLPDYRLAPEHPAPAALDDCQAAYARLLRDVPSRRIVLVGDSAGGNLALALLQRCKRLGLPLPAGALLLSPVTDFCGGSWSTRTNERSDAMFTSHAFDTVVTHYLPNNLAEDPEVSPLLGDWSGLPPLRFHVSGSEMLLDDSLRAVERARVAGVDAQATVWPDLPHVFPLFGMLPQARQCRAETAAFVTQLLSPAPAAMAGKWIASAEPMPEYRVLPVANAGSGT